MVFFQRSQIDAHQVTGIFNVIQRIVIRGQETTEGVVAFAFRQLRGILLFKSSR